MGNLWLKIKVWTKITVMALLAVYLLLFIFKNVDQKITIWIWFGHVEETTALRLIVVMLAVGVVGTLLTRTVLRTIRQVRELRQQSRTAEMHKNVSEMQAKAAMLQTKPQTPGSGST